MGDEDPLRTLVRGAAGAIHTEDLLIEAIRDLVREEMKEHIRDTLEANPYLKAELKAAVRELIEAKAKEAVALLKVAKATAKVGVEMLPKDLRADLTRDLVLVFEKQITSLLERT